METRSLLITPRCDEPWLCDAGTDCSDCSVAAGTNCSFAAGTDRRCRFGVRPLVATVAAEAVSATGVDLALTLTLTLTPALTLTLILTLTLARTLTLTLTLPLTLTLTIRLRPRARVRLSRGTLQRCCRRAARGDAD